MIFYQLKEINSSDKYYKLQKGKNVAKIDHFPLNGVTPNNRFNAILGKGGRVKCRECINNNCTWGIIYLVLLFYYFTHYRLKWQKVVDLPMRNEKETR